MTDQTATASAPCSRCSPEHLALFTTDRIVIVNEHGHPVDIPLPLFDRIRKICLRCARRFWTLGGYMSHWIVDHGMKVEVEPIWLERPELRAIACGHPRCPTGGGELLGDFPH